METAPSSAAPTQQVVEVAFGGGTTIRGPSGEMLFISYDSAASPPISIALPEEASDVTFTNLTVRNEGSAPFSGVLEATVTTEEGELLQPVPISSLPSDIVELDGLPQDLTQGFSLDPGGSIEGFFVFHGFRTGDVEGTFALQIPGGPETAEWPL